MEVAQVLTGISKDTFINTPNVKESFIESVATALYVPENTINITNVTEYTQTTNAAKQSLQQQHKSTNHLFLRSSHRNLDASNVQLQINYVVRVLVDPTDLDNSNTIINSLQDTIQTSVSSGQFSDILQSVSKSYSIQAFINVTTNQVVIQAIKLLYNSPSPTFSPTSEPTQPHHSNGGTSKAFNTTYLILIVVLGTFFICVLIGCTYYLRRTKRNLKIIPVAPSTPQFDEVQGALVSVETNKPSNQIIEKKKSSHVYLAAGGEEESET